MPVLRLSSVAFAHPSAPPLFSDVALHLEPGWYGLVGENGTGKTTLVSLLAGSLAPTEGERRLEPATATIATCAQSVDTPAPEVLALGAAVDRVATRLRATLALDPDGLARWPTLSPGERRRWQLAAALAREPDVLLVDEPTNHLDRDARERVVRALAAHRGIGVVVSHDRALLAALTTHTIRIARRTVVLHAGPYAEAKRAWEAEARAIADARGRLHAEVRGARTALGDARREHEAAERERSAGRRMRDRNDSDARGGLATQMASWGEARRGRDVHGARRRLADAERALAEAPTTERERGRELVLCDVRAGGPIALSIDVGELAAGARTILRDVRVALHARERVHLSGPNGAGKTTLVRALVAASPPERVFYLPQELPDDEAARTVERFLAMPPDLRGRALAVVAALGLDADRLLRTRRASPGEARKLAIGGALARGTAAIVLDEPTNHLDLPSVERLERALAAYRGALLVVSHDQAFASAVTDRLWRIEGDRVI